jgi:hypothetical protein
VLNHLIHAPNFFGFSYFSQRVSRLCLGFDSATYACHVAEMTGMSYHTEFLLDVMGMSEEIFACAVLQWRSS